MPLATVNKGGRVVTAEGWVIQGRGGGAKYNLQEQHLLFQINKKTAEKAAIENELMILEMSLQA